MKVSEAFGLGVTQGRSRRNVNYQTAHDLDRMLLPRCHQDLTSTFLVRDGFGGWSGLRPAFSAGQSSSVFVDKSAATRAGKPGLDAAPCASLNKSTARKERSRRCSPKSVLEHVDSEEGEAAARPTSEDSTKTLFARDKLEDLSGLRP